MYRATPQGPETERLKQATRAILAGRGEPAPGEPLNPSPVFASAFHANGSLGYAREGNPTWRAFEEALGSLEGGIVTAFSSGMAAIAAVLEDLPLGARVLIPETAYVEVRRLLGERAASGRLELTGVDVMDTELAVRAAAGCDLVWLESLSNPLLQVPDLAAIVDAARAAGAVSVVDATLATPSLQRPLALGADLVVHSATKYIGGHSDLLLGAAATRDPDRAERLREARNSLGAVPGTMEAFLALRGLRTLPLRIERASATAAELARRLERHPGVARVSYPGLAAHPGHRRARRLLDGFGAMLAFEPAGGVEHADAVCEAVRVFTHATSLGGVESLIERRSRCRGEDHIPPGLLRASIGCEDLEDLWDDLARALNPVG